MDLPQPDAHQPDDLALAHLEAHPVHRAHRVLLHVRAEPARKPLHRVQALLEDLADYAQL